MTTRGKFGWQAALVMATVGLAVLGVYFAVSLLSEGDRLSTADQWGSVAGAALATASLPLTIYGLVLARRPRPTIPPEESVASAVPEPSAAPAHPPVPPRVTMSAGRDAYYAAGDQNFFHRPESR